MQTNHRLLSSGVVSPHRFLNMVHHVAVQAAGVMEEGGSGAKSSQRRQEPLNDNLKYARRYVQLGTCIGKVKRGLQ